MNRKEFVDLKNLIYFRPSETISDKYQTCNCSNFTIVFVIVIDPSLQNVTKFAKDIRYCKKCKSPCHSFLKCRKAEKCTFAS
jgi:hypothetical protein